MTDLRLTKRFAALLMAGGLVAGCGTSSPNKIDYKSDSKSKQVSLAIPPNLIDETPDQRSLPPQGGEASLSSLKQVQQAAPATTDVVVPVVSNMHIQRDGSESWLVIDNKSPDQAWPQIRRFWQEQGFLLVVDQRAKGVMETDWNETHPKVNDGLIRNTLTLAMGNSYVTAERNKYRTRLEPTSNGGTYVFISQKGMREALTGTNNENSKWEPKPNDPGLETEYLKRLMATLAVNDSRAGTGNTSAALTPAGSQDAPGAATAGAKSAAAATAAQNVALAAQTPARSDSSDSSGSGAQFTSTELTLGEPYDRAWVRVGIALDRSNFTVDDRDRANGLYYIRYVDPTDLSEAEQGFWSQVFHGKKEKVAKQYRVNVRAVTPEQTRVAVVDAAGQTDSSKQAKQIMSLVVDQLR
ncbi:MULTISPECIES: outer membrane protein assembly factor BamC [Paraburkholderia]|uniref:Beta-barrel assembly machine subunit BamC n=1 Tax=Paraburkholderia megapolitana TaxID=420953 RepID=A0A1I3W5W1_9BURK|nr:MULTISPECIES: outer membrane protein assembly factor BamC [Paraburkholderia]MCX4165945.1 outer membrane protein assembly factor BamC [Paraburkholderia megapolitana]MDN7161436.1 outer membrane protein assembly factor BamC [Paraburkholderia sp. CHISQ3]MDQ6498483.1 outer membrane protein assembly factor BamC [Paraburkholderia megapolitana]QDQ84608.1 outer membrane protein assembly factor BamC [Paraburkholderia megapolitana]SFK02057.1 Beta-barrel assembly machine subunit BamC [Paraburkholderia 